MRTSQRFSLQMTSSLTWAGQVKSSTPSRCGEKSDLTKPHRQALLWPALEGEQFFSTTFLNTWSCSQTFTSFTSSQDTLLPCNNLVGGNIKLRGSKFSLTAKGVHKYLDSWYINLHILLHKYAIFQAYSTWIPA